MVIGMNPCKLGYGVSLVGVVLTNLALVRLRKGSPSPPLG
jgi:hypothetical protein